MMEGIKCRQECCGRQDYANFTKGGAARAKSAGSRMGRASCARLLNALSTGEKDMMQEKKDMIQGKKDMMQEKSLDTTTEETFEIEGLTGVEQNTITTAEARSTISKDRATTTGIDPRREMTTDLRLEMTTDLPNEGTTRLTT
mmetsp:Transcript_17689/g.29734  ORF Transcript_17689/g.29734 Transcript_17689/m.29734 type:complete len:143 (+) Transcript_17689:434-862(+)